MANVLFTDPLIRNQRTKPKQFEIFDKKIRGLGLRVSPGGTKSFVLLYRMGRRRCRFTIGSYPSVRLADARRRAQDSLSLVAKGVDPQAEKRRGRDDSTSNAFRDRASEFIENYAKRYTRSWKEADRIIKNEFVRRWRSTPIHQITKRTINTALDEIVENSGPSAGNHAFAVVRRFFNWSVEQCDLDRSPCLGMKAPAKTSERDRFLFCP